MSTETSTYRRDLVLALRARQVPGDRIGEIVAEVESHVADTGEDPVEAFGRPKEYAATLAPAPRGGKTVLGALALSGAAVGWLVATSVFDLVEGDAKGLPAGLPSWVPLVLAVLLWIPAVVVTMRRNERVRDPRTGEWLTPSPRWVPVVMGGFLIVLGALVWLVAALTV
ncbi:UNVERIFIED_ORG: hypothetical protein E4P37_04790 [Bacillus sp. AZ43]